MVKTTAIEQKNELIPSPTATPSVLGCSTCGQKAKVDYSLPYPGSILPGHPLYSLKMIRDKVWLMVTSDSLKKAELLLHFADKRLITGKILIEKGQSELGVTTLEKAEKYLEQALAQEKIANSRKRKTADFLGSLILSTQKHEEVLFEMKTKAGDSFQKEIDDLLAYPRRIGKGAQKALER